MSERKPWYRVRNIVLAVLLLIVLLVGYQLWFALSARPGVAIDYNAELERRLDELMPRPEGAENSWPLVIALADRSSEIRIAADERVESAEEERGVFDPLGWEDGVPRFGAWATFFIGEFERDGAERLSELPSAWARRPRGSGLFLGQLFPEMQPWRQLAQANTARMVDAFSRGDESGGVARFEETLAMGRVMSRQGFLIHHLVGHSIVELALDRVRRVMAEGGLSVAGLDGIAGAMDRQLPLPSLAIALECEKLMFLQVVQATHTDNGHGDGRFLLAEFLALGLDGTGGFGGEPAPASRVLNVTHVAFPSKRATVSFGERYYGGVIRDLGQARSRRTWSDEEMSMELLRHPSRLVRVLMPAFGHIFAVQDQHDCQVSGTRVMVSIERHRALTGSLPASLGVPGELPTDPLREGSFGYRVLGEDESHYGCRGYVLYSFGSDGVDDGGVPPLRLVDDGSGGVRREVDQSRVLRGQAGTYGMGDYVFNLVREPEVPEEQVEERAPVPF